MTRMRAIGQTLQAEQNLTSTDIAWLTGIAAAILRVFVWDAGRPMRTLADDLEIAPQTLYTKIRQVVQVLMLVRRGQQSVETLMNRVNELQDRLAQVEPAYATAQSEVQHLTKRVAQLQAQVVALQDAVIRWQEQWTTGCASLFCVKKKW